MSNVSTFPVSGALPLYIISFGHLTLLGEAVMIKWLRMGKSYLADEAQPHPMFDGGTGNTGISPLFQQCLMHTDETLG